MILRNFLNSAFLWNKRMLRDAVLKCLCVLYINHNCSVPTMSYESKNIQLRWIFIVMTYPELVIECMLLKQLIYFK